MALHAPPVGLAVAHSATSQVLGVKKIENYPKLIGEGWKVIGAGYISQRQGSNKSKDAQSVGQKK